MIRARARAKINLGLRVLAREESGFHQIETLFCRIDLADDVEVRFRDDDAAGAVTLDVVSGDAVLGTAPGQPLDLGPAEKNLAWRAAVAYREAAAGSGREGRTAQAGAGVHIRLVKRIPAGAGLGGGSADAAAVLRALNELHGAPLSEQALLEVGARLGSDVPFLLTRASLALAWGRGGRMLPLPALPVATVVLAVPPAGVPTADAYSALSHSRESAGPDGAAAAALFGLMPAVRAVPTSWRQVAEAAHNDFEDVVFRRMPLLAGVRRAFEKHGATLARMTGTGSVVFGIFEEATHAADAAAALADEIPEVALLAARTVGAESVH